MATRKITILVVLASLSPVRAGPSDDVDQPTLSARDLKKYFEPYVPAVKECYVVNANGHDVDGTLRLELVIRPGGDVIRFGFVAPGVAGAWLRRLDGCLRRLSDTWHFPVRRSYTTAVMPFLFERTFAPGAGPKPQGGL